MKLTDYFVSRIRTVVPVVVGTVIAVLVKKIPALEPIMKEAEVSAWLIPLCIGLYYDLVRRFEKKYPQFGWLLGMAKQPGYSDAPPPAPAPNDNPAYPVDADGDIVPIFVNDDLDDAGEDERQYEKDVDHAVPGDLLELSERLEEVGMTPAAFAALFPQEARR